MAAMGLLQSHIILYISVSLSVIMPSCPMLDTVLRRLCRPPTMFYRGLGVMIIALPRNRGSATWDDRTIKMKTMSSHTRTAHMHEQHGRYAP